MHQVLADASLPDVSTLLSPLAVNLYHDTTSLLKQINTHDILICRSTLKVNSQLLRNSAVKIVGTASSGSEHIDKQFCKEQGISWFNARGANAHAVADYICMIIASLKKNNCTIGKVAGIVGYGAVGTAVKQRLDSLGFIVKCCDPWLIEKTDFHHTKLEDLKDCDLLLLHCNYHQNPPYPSHHLINKDFLDAFNPKGIIINAARGSIVDETALLNSAHSLNYCSDVFKNEPNINPKIIKKSMIVTPHIAGHSCEAKYNAVVIIAEKILPEKAWLLLKLEEDLP